MSTHERLHARPATISAEERRAIRARMLTINLLGIALAGIAFLVWRVNDLAHAVHQLNTGS